VKIKVGSAPDQYSLSPLFLRYIHQVHQLLTHFPDIKNYNILEIGGGFGGHCAVLSVAQRPRNYNIVDLPAVAQLVNKYLSATETKARAWGYNDPGWHERAPDLLISHYCFSEIDADKQDVYLPIIKKSPRGFMICNIINRKSHHMNKIIGWIADAHPDAQVLPEVPETFRGNYVLVWGAAQNL